MKQNETKKVPKSSEIYKCNSCDYVTSRKSQYERHLTTDKHKNGTFETNETKKVPKSSIKLQCYCNLHFNSRTTLWRHKKICSTINDNTIIINDKLVTLLLSEPESNADIEKQVYDHLVREKLPIKPIIILSFDPLEYVIMLDKPAEKPLKIKKEKFKSKGTNAIHLFFADNPGKDISTISELWRNLPHIQKEEYINKAKLARDSFNK
jgi:hypothetical protein